MAILASFGFGRLVLVVVARGFLNGVWRSSGQLGHYTGFHGNTIFLEVMGRRVPEPEPEPPVTYIKETGCSVEILFLLREEVLANCSARC